MNQKKQIIYELDTRNKKDDYVTKYFDKQGIKWIRNKLYAGDKGIVNTVRSNTKC